ncbi:hypothetical protein [Stutzerimonas nitrititolerans]|uniref:hypothetical protein n=1 Tax=Stutzerimonas nitrititolerans TaxID=2482751 RepID=UPI0028B039CA|nr:hypothetical protein [Stutzerimonas nitrititolerans]
MLIISIPWLELGFFLSLRLLTDSPGVAEQLAAATQNLALIISGVLCAQMLQQPLEQVGDVVCQKAHQGMAHYRTTAQQPVD